MIENNTYIEEKRKLQCSQQKFASQMPRGTRLDSSGSKLELKGARNYTSQSVFIEPDEMFEDIVLRGMRADGLSSKLGVRNNKESISKLVSSLLTKDPRHDVAMQHYHSKRQKNNCAKTIFATMTTEELKMLRDEMFPTTIDLQIRNKLQSFFEAQRHKLKETIEVLIKLQETFKQLAPVADLLSMHNFQTRGFFIDVMISMSNFIIQVLEDVDTFGLSGADTTDPAKDYPPQLYPHNEKTAAEILLSVGSNLPRNQRESSIEQAITADKPTTVVIDSNTKEDRTQVSNDQVEDTCKEWTTVEMVEGDGQTRYLLVKTPKGEDGTIDAEKLIQLLHNNEAVVLDSPSIQTTEFLNYEEEHEVVFHNPPAEFQNQEIIPTTNPIQLQQITHSHEISGYQPPHETQASNPPIYTVTENTANQTDPHSEVLLNKRARLK